MIECLILGDSIASGISNVRRECTAIVKVGINSVSFVNHNPGPHEAQTVIISLGSNDVGVRTRESLELLRSKTVANKVFWIIPNVHPEVKNIVRDIAVRNGDSLIDMKDSFMSPDKVHPTRSGYISLSNSTK